MMRVALSLALVALQTLHLTIARVSLTPPDRKLEITGSVSEVHLNNLQNGYDIIPTTNVGGPNGVEGLAGTGSVVFDETDGVKFLLGGQQNTNTAYYQFSGATIGNWFDCARGSFAFTVKSSHSWAARQGLADHYLFYTQDDGGIVALFVIRVFASSPNRLKFEYGVCGSGTEFDVDAGQEDVVFGSGVSLAVEGIWNSSTNSFSLKFNGSEVQSFFYNPTTMNWGSQSQFILGANGGGSTGYNSLDEYLKNFILRSLS